MNARQANAIPLSEILNKLSCKPQKTRGEDHLYFSPFRDERTPSFHVNAADNVWYDFGEERGGDIVDFACAYLESRNVTSGISEALRFLDDMGSFSLSVEFSAKTERNGPALEVLETYSLRHHLLLNYLVNIRMIPLHLARKYLTEVKVRNHNTGKTIYAIGMKNADGGYELRTCDSKLCVGKKDVTVIRGTSTPAKEVHVFEGFMDMLSALADEEIDAFPGDVIILHSLANLSKALAYIENYESYNRIISWVDNDRAGDKATRFLQKIAQQQAHLSFCAMNSTYAAYKDVNENRVERLGLPPMR